ncbi:hypothetical protein [Bradyrhizobium sp. 149]|uniref:hypothetical protein n=1 Tax=Bradyrhizobium sp. 149 TaxID=2782624 RepID=UPI001FF9F4B3|nr:hypothetical protein [Bradyrhizobium sp. 149]
MNMIETTSAALSGQVTTVKRSGLSRDFPSGNPDLMWLANSPRELYGAVLKPHSDRADPGSLWSGANATKVQRS